jgi:hypothetical protein
MVKCLLAEAATVIQQFAFSSGFPILDRLKSVDSVCGKVFYTKQ